MAMPLLPQEVQRQGVNVTKASTGFLMVIGFVSEDDSMTKDDIAVYVSANIVDPLSRVPGVGNLMVFGSQYAMRIWLDPNLLETYRLSPGDIIAAVQAENQQVAVIRETRPVELHHTAHAPIRERVGQLKREPILLLFSLLALFFRLIYTQGHVSLPLDMQSNGLGPQPYGAAVAVNGFLIILVTIPVSNMATKWRRFETMALSAVFLGLGFGFTAFANTLPLYMLSVVIWTLGEITATAVAPAIIADLSPVELRGLYQGIFGSAWGLAFFLGPLAGGWIYDHLSSDILWGVCLALGIFIAFGYLAMSKPAKRHMEPSRTHQIESQ